MSDEYDDDAVRAAFGRLRDDAMRLDTMAALEEVNGRRHRVPRLAIGLAGAAMATLLAFVGFAIWDGDETPVEQVLTGEPDGGAAIDDLRATSWALVSGTGPEGDIPLVDGRPVTLRFDGDTVGGTAACNSYGGRFTLDGEMFTVRDLSQTEMACEDGTGEVMRSESLYLAAFRDVLDLALVDGQLVLTGPSIELTFEPEAPAPVADLVGQLWLLDTLIRGDAASTVQGEAATLLLREDGTLEGGTGCRTLTGEYVVTGAEVTFTSFAADGECPAELADQDDLVVTVLGDGFSAEIDGDRLTLMSAGNDGLSYVAVDGEGDPTTGADVPANSTFADIACQETTSAGVEITDPGGVADHVVGIESFESPDCRRTVFEIGSDLLSGDPKPLRVASTGDFAPFVGTLPGVSVSVPSGCEGVELAVGEPCPSPAFGIDFEVELLDTSVGVAALAQTADGRLYLYVDHGASDSSISFWPDPARIIVDTPMDPATAPVPVVGEVILPRPIPTTAVGDPVEVGGMARPFEATGAVSLRRAPQVGAAPGSGDPVTATWSGFDVLGDGHVDSRYGYQTASIDTWGDFAIAIDGLEAGDYELLFESFAPEESGSPGTYVTFSVAS